MRVTIKSIEKKHAWVHIRKIKDNYVFYNFFLNEIDEAKTLVELDKMIDEYAKDPSGYIDRQLKECYGDYYKKK